MLALLLSIFFFTSALANPRVQLRCGEWLARARSSGFDASALSEGLAGRYFIFENESSTRPLGLVERRAFGLSDESVWRPDELTFQFSAGDGASLRLSAQVGFEKVGRRALISDDLELGFQNLSVIFENAETFRDRALDRLIARSLGRSLRATVPLVQIGRQWVSLLFVIVPIGERFKVGSRIDLVLTRPCREDRLGPEVLVTEKANVCLTKLGQLSAPGIEPLRKERPTNAPEELRP